MPTLAIFQLYRSGDKMKKKMKKPTADSSKIQSKIDTLNTNTQDRSLTFLD